MVETEKKDNQENKEETTTKPFDKGYKNIFGVKKNFLDFLKKYVALDLTKDLTEDNLEEIDKEFISREFETYESDIIYKITLPKKEKTNVSKEEQEEGPEETIYMFILQEMQSKVDYTMPFRLLAYMFFLWMREFKNMKAPNRKDFKLPAIMPCVLYNGQNNWTAKREFADVIYNSAMLGKYGVNFQYVLIDVKRLARDFICEGNTVMDNVLYLDNLKEPEELLEWMENMSKRISQMSYDERKETEKWINLIVTHRLGKEKAEEVLEFIRTGDDDKMSTGFDQLMDELEERGIEKGKEKGREEANIETAQILLMENMTISLIVKATRLPKEKVEKIRAEMIKNGQLEENEQETE